MSMANDQDQTRTAGRRAMGEAAVPSRPRLPARLAAMTPGHQRSRILARARPSAARAPLRAIGAIKRRSDGNPNERARAAREAGDLPFDVEIGF